MQRRGSARARDAWMSPHQGPHGGEAAVHCDHLAGEARGAVAEQPGQHLLDVFRRVVRLGLDRLDSGCQQIHLHDHRRQASRVGRRRFWIFKTWHLHQSKNAAEPLVLVTAVAVKRVIAWQIEQEMAAQKLTKTAMAKKMRTSRASLNRLLDENDTSLTLTTLAGAAAALGRRIKLELAPA